MSNYNLNMNKNTRVSVSPIEGGVLISGPDHPRGVPVMRDSYKSDDQFKAEARKKAQAQVKAANKEQDDYLEKAQAQREQQAEQFEEQLENTLNAALN